MNRSVVRELQMAGMRTSQDSMSSARLSMGSNGNTEEKTIYENLMEIFPLMEDFMKNQGSMTRTSFAHQAPVSFTRAPSRQVPQKRKLEQKPVWANGEDTFDRSEAVKSSNGPLAQDLQRDVEELSNRLRETQLQSTFATKELQSTLESKEIQIVEMELMVRRLQKEVQRREQLAFSAQKELADTKGEIARMRLIMQKAESNIVETTTKAAGFEQDLLDVQLQLSALHSQVDANDQILSQSLQNVFHGTSSTVESLGQAPLDRIEWYRRNSKRMELARRAYLAAVIVARETNEESPLMLCAVLRFQLQAFLRQTDFFVDSQVAGLSFPRTEYDLAVS